MIRYCFALIATNISFDDMFMPQVGFWFNLAVDPGAADRLARPQRLWSAWGMTVGRAYLEDVRLQFEKMKKLAEGAVAQLEDDELLVRLDPESNSVVLVMRHMAGNLRSRFRDFLTTDGEKPDRNRDAEFEEPGPLTRAEIVADWERGWQTLFSALAALGEDDLLRDVFIRGERHSVIQALDRQLTHHAYHVGQIVFLAKHFRSAAWQSLSIPRNRR